MSTATNALLLPLDSPEATLDVVGGKGAALARLTQAGLPVPGGFHITTAAYRQFVDANQIHAALAATNLEDAGAASRSAAEIHLLFERGRLDSEFADAVRVAYRELSPGGLRAVAVRSSATAEDLPELSFAGQLDTYLNVRGEDALIEAVRHCWGSLWTARAIAYRAQNGIASESVAMGVVVQSMVRAQAAGVLFTANPVTGERGELVVNASFGLGEAIVRGDVNPDTYHVDRASVTVLAESIGDKQMQVVEAEDGGTRVVATPDAIRGERVLTDQWLRQLLDLAVRAETVFDGVPQDIEWAIDEQTCWILQSRPITHLPPAPLRDVRWESPIPGTAWIRRQVVENMPEPLSPLFAELYLREGLDRSADAIYAALHVSPSVNRLVDRPLFTTVNGFAYMRGSINFGWWAVPILIRAYLSGLPMLFKAGPGYWRDEALPAYLATISGWKAVRGSLVSDKELLEGVRQLAYADAVYWFAAALAIGVAKVTDGILSWFLAHGLAGTKLTSGVFLRGFPSRTLEAEAAIDRLVDQLRHSDHLLQIVRETPARNLPDVLSREPEAQGFVRGFADYLDRYGHQIYNLDFVEPTQAEDPFAIVLSIKALASPSRRDVDAQRATMARERDNAVAVTARSLDPLRRRLFELTVGWAQHFAPYREEALFYMGAAWPTVRRLALELGSRLVQAESLERADDVFFLETAELDAACAARADAQPRPDLARRARERRELREARKRLHPPAAVPPDYHLKLGPVDYSFFETQQRNVDRGPVLRGFAVSPGVVTGPASVIRSPAEFEQMQADSILVCPTTTPAWTPLFAQARGLVTDVGGILAHGSIVAREYGIPAVMGTGTATQRIEAGDVISVDGDAGTVTLHRTDRGRPV